METQPFDGLELESDHTTLDFDSSEVQYGVTTDIILISVGSL